METKTNFPGMPDGNQSVGKVAVLYGTVKAVATDGTERVLTPNSPIFFGDHIITGADGMISITFDADMTQLDLGRMSDAFIDQDVIGGEQTAMEEIAAQVADIQQALAEGSMDQILDLPAPAAGGGVAGAGGGHPYPVFDLDGDSVLPEFGQETTGITYTALDPVGGGIVPAPQPLTPVTEAGPVTGPATAPANGEPAAVPIIAVEEEEPVIPPPPPPAPEDFTPTVAVTDGMVWESALAENGSGIPEDGSVTAEGIITYTSPDGLDKMEVQDKDGNWIDVTAGGSVQGLYGTLVVSVSPGGEYSWSYTLTQNWLDHDNTTTDGTPGDRGVDDQLFDNFATRVTDPQGDSTDADGIQPNEIITIAINDDGPSVGNPQDAILVNQEGNSLVGDLAITFGADGQAEVNALVLNPLNNLGAMVTGGDFVVGNAGEQITAGGQPLIWMQNSDGSWSAVVDYGNNETMPVFTIIPGADNHSYEVVMHGEIDWGTMVSAADEGGGNSQHNYSETGMHYRTVDTSGDFKIYITATIPDYDGGYEDNQKINWSDQGTGVGNDQIDGVDDGTGGNYLTESDALIIRMYANEAFNPDGSLNPEHSSDLYSVTSATFLLDHLDQAHTHGHEDLPDEISYWYAYENGVLVGSGSIPGEGQGSDPAADQHVTIDADDLDAGTGFDTVVFTGGTLGEGDSDGYRVKVESMVVAEEEHKITVAYTAEDGDGDRASSTFDVTFDSNGSIEGTDENEVIAGGTGDDVIHGGGGDDVIYGYEGSDTIDGGNGSDTINGGASDDTLSGGAGSDALDGGPGADTLEGGEGDDVLLGGEDDSEPDDITGGTGADTFDTNEATDAGSPDTTDYNAGEDNVDDLVPPVEPDPTA